MSSHFKFMSVQFNLHLEIKLKLMFETVAAMQFDVTLVELQIVWEYVGAPYENISISMQDWKYWLIVML